jgi:putative SOS response-associated peptidase YedK
MRWPPAAVSSRHRLLRVRRAAGTERPTAHAYPAQDGQVFAFAGLWLAGKRGGVPSAAIVTTVPNELMAIIHTRMPAILRPEDKAAWLDPQLTDAQQVMALVKSYPTECV